MVYIKELDPDGMITLDERADLVRMMGKRMANGL